MKFELPYFGEINPNKLEENYDAELPFHGRDVTLDLNFVTRTIAADALDATARHLRNLEAIHRENLAAIVRNYEEGKEVRYYINEHLQQMDPDDLAATLKSADPSKSKALAMVDCFYLKRVGFYPNDSKLVCDYTVNENCIDDLVVVSRNFDGTIEGIVIES